MQSKATTVEQYLAELPEDRRAAIEAVRQVILKNLDKGYEEGMQYGMIGYFVPHRLYSAGYHCDPRQPLPFASLASQKNYMSVYLMGMYIGEDQAWLQKAFEKAGKKADMGKCCVRFKKLDDLPLEVIGEAIKKVPAKLYIEYYEANLGSRAKSGAKKAPTKKPAAKKAAAKAATKKAAKKVAKKPAAKKTSRR